MVAPRRRFRYRKRKSAKRSAVAKRSRKMTITRTLRAPKQQVFPNIMKMKLNYEESFRGTGAETHAYYRLNSLYDPQYSYGTGVVAIGGQQNNQQPLFYDQIANIYTQYKVLATKVDIYFQNMSTTIPGYVCIQGAPGDNIPTDIDPILMSTRPLAQVKNLGILGDDNSRVRLTAYYPAHVPLGIIKKEYVSDDDYSSAVNNSPALNNTGILYVMISSIDSSTSISVIARVKLTFYVQFMQPNRSIGAS